MNAKKMHLFKDIICNTVVIPGTVTTDGLAISIHSRNANTVEPLWKGQECLTTVAKFGPVLCTILYKSYLFYPSWQATSFERPPS